MLVLNRLLPFEISNYQEGGGGHLSVVHIGGIVDHPCSNLYFVIERNHTHHIPCNKAG